MIILKDGVSDTEKMENLMVINNNCHSHHVTPEALKNVQLVQNKFTFLKSNQLTAQYKRGGSVRSTDYLQSSPISPLNAYDHSSEEMTKYLKTFHEKSEKMLKIRSQAHQSLMKLAVEKAEEHKKLDANVKKMEMMEQNMFFKVTDIMCGRNSSSYCRKEIEYEQIPLQDMKNTTCDRAQRKLQATRKEMNKKTKNLQEKLSQQNIQSVSSSQITQSSFQDVSNSFSNLINSKASSVGASKKKDQLYYRKQLKNKPYETVIAEQRRKMCKAAFSGCWELGNKDKKMKKITQPEKEHHLKKIVRRQEWNDNSIFNDYRDGNKFQLQIHKKYSSAFDLAVEGFGIHQVKNKTKKDFVRNPEK